jgi:hypothetical protein
VIDLTCLVCNRSYQPKRLTGTNKYCSGDCARAGQVMGLSKKRNPIVPVGETKECTKCHRVLDLSEFTPRKARSNRPVSHCRRCAAEYASTKHARALAAEWRYQKRYGTTSDAVHAEYERLGGNCAICSEPLEREQLHVDHDHATGKFRGILCAKCNSGLGMFRDDVDFLRAAIRYLEQSK